MGYTSQEIAVFLGVSRRRIRQRLIRIKKMIAEYIG
jgi:DNA-directed RNA polymerase specialized sigma24 family protein